MRPSKLMVLSMRFKIFDRTVEFVPYVGSSMHDEDEGPFPKTFQRRRWRVKNSDETDKLSAKNMLLTLKSEKMKFGMRESKHAMMFGGTSSLKKERICSKFYIMVKRMLRYFP